ncbi:hypothetical protein CRN76_05225 [Chryseobacterium indologenes]|uniref:hypothetical protein n=1 Tax=Chryseobacterium indologenes TaxID=253 RepID=UPI000BFB74A1|nr:hypothetical protein [Chryseobacterium indologenes]ATN04842.1 hypothetical protein CRN76_05225 [Chryseobacterium indologenes]AYY86404.1 hypothetical protein EGX91_18530 [Chryseobacterium indologenes]QIX83304.1 hypothetical protein FOB56_19535 [Chryseobacterium indologenes]TLX23314.1 hypothetical protein FE904_22520 [Chryseobacterium indologenes]UDQ52992.1 hypothetical protein LJF28_16315 [Chryseobacterium indologenes]
MKDFKVVFPSGYNVNDYYDDNIDLNIILPNGRVFFATFFTVLNINNLIEKENALYFWSTDMIIVRDLKKETIRSVVFRMIDDGYLESGCSDIGEIHEIFPNIEVYHDIVSDI